MMNLKVGRTHWLGGMLCFSLLSAWGAFGAEPTAFELIKEGNRYVGEQSKDKVLEIRSDKSVTGLTPSIWYVVYFDPDVTSRRAQVKFGAGRQMGIKHNWRPLGGGGIARQVAGSQEAQG